MCVYGVKVLFILVVECGIGMVKKVKELVEKYGWFWVSQFENLVNLVYYRSIIGLEIFKDFVGKWLDYFVSGWGIGGMFIGVGEMFKLVCLEVKVIGVELVGVVLLVGKEWQLYKIQGWNLDFIFKVFNCEVIDEIKLILDECLCEVVCVLVVQEGIFVGLFCGGILVVVLEVVEDVLKGLVLLVMLLDMGECYLFIYLFEGINEGLDDVG